MCENENLCYREGQHYLGVDIYTWCGFPSGAVVKNLPAYAGDTVEVGLIPRLGRSPGTGNGKLLPSSRLENSMDRGAWWAIVHGVAE